MLVNDGPHTSGRRSIEQRMKLRMEFGFTSPEVTPGPGAGRRPAPPLTLSARLIIPLAVTLLSFGSAMGQDTTKAPAGGVTSPEPGLTVISNPNGALVELKGVANLAGLSPVFFSQGIPGRYELRVSKTGYETYHTTVRISGDRVEQVDVRLDPKSRGKAAIRSLLWPGWGQFYSGQKTKGVVMTGLALVSGAAVFLAETDYQDKKDDFDVIQARYQDALTNGSSTILPVLRTRLEVAQADAYDAESLRRAAIGGAIAVWSIGFLDALFFFPDASGRITVRDVVITPESDLKTGYAGLRASISF